MNQSPANQRRKIVIPLGGGRRSKTTGPMLSQERTAKQSMPRQRSRIVKVLAILAVSLLVIVVLAAGGVFLWWQHYKTTPAYSLAVLIDGAQRNDMTAVQSIID